MAYLPSRLAATVNPLLDRLWRPRPPLVRPSRKWVNYLRYAVHHTPLRNVVVPSSLKTDL